MTRVQQIVIVVAIAVLASFWPDVALSQTYGAPGDPAGRGPADPLVVESTAQGWLWASSVWSTTAERKDLVGGRTLLQLGVGKHGAEHWGVALRAESIGMPGAYDRAKPETFRALQLYAAVHRNVGAAPHAVYGPAVFGGVALGLQNGEGQTAILPKPFTFGVGGRASGSGWWAYVGLGQYQALKGMSFLLTAHVPTTSRMAWVGDFAIGRRSYVATIGVAVRTF